MFVIIKLHTNACLLDGSHSNRLKWQWTAKYDAKQFIVLFVLKVVWKEEACSSDGHC